MTTVTDANGWTGEPIPSRNGVTGPASVNFERSHSRNERRKARLTSILADLTERERQLRQRAKDGDERAQALLRFGQRWPDMDRAQRVLVWEAQKTAKWCASCGGDFADGQGVWWRRGAPICRDCAPPDDGYLYRWVERTCIGCGRPVTEVVSVTARVRRYRAVCSQRCYVRYQSSTRAAQRADDRLRDCQTCGERFTPPRSDGRYCSPACRQKAYRRRRGGGSDG